MTTIAYVALALALVGLFAAFVLSVSNPAAFKKYRWYFAIPVTAAVLIGGVLFLIA